MPTWPERVQIVEVAPRDGLQNEPETVATADKLGFIELLAGSGLRQIEATSFVSPRAVPQLADAADVIRGTVKTPRVTYSALVPNLEGLDRAIAAGVKRIAVFTAASETFALRNINMSVEESLTVFAAVMRDALSVGVSVRAYLSTCFVCPYEGEIAKERVAELAERLLALGADQVSISDTVGAAAPREVFETVECCRDRFPVEKLALHFHDTRGTALANVLAGLELGVTTFDASTGGLGGCPFAPGAAGNLATEDLVYMLDRMGIETGVNLAEVIAAGRFISDVLGRQLSSRNLRRLAADTE